MQNRAMEAPTDIHRVLLLHGLWMPALAMRPLARRLSAAGFEPEVFGYHAALGGPEAAIERLGGRLRERPAHVVAHSLGGLITLQALEREPDLPVSRVVCLGSPLCGSAAAGGLARHRWAGRALGRSAELLRCGCRPWRGRAQVGAVAGRMPLGLGQLFGGFDGESDGTVAVAETRLEGLADHVVVAASHSTMLVSPQVARQVVAFLREGRFHRDAPL
jgi:pimeloyl-ACP methyl ester carboxylesterase